MIDQGESDDADTTRDVEFNSAERVIFFSDAVAAIAITLLAFALPVPHVGVSANNDMMLRHLAGETSAYIPFLISFVVIGAHWRAHHRLFRSIAALDRYVIAVNMVWLLMIIITPYATRVLAIKGDQDFGVRFSLYAIIQVITLIALWLMSMHLRHGRLLRPGVPAALSVFDQRAVLIAAGMFAISIPVAFATQWAYLCWVAAGVLTRWVRRAQVWTGRPGWRRSAALYAARGRRLLRLRR